MCVTVAIGSDGEDELDGARCVGAVDPLLELLDVVVAAAVVIAGVLSSCAGRSEWLDAAR
jgi:hypothetical protein